MSLLSEFPKMNEKFRHLVSFSWTWDMMIFSQLSADLWNCPSVFLKRRGRHRPLQLALKTVVKRSTSIKYECSQEKWGWRCAIAIMAVLVFSTTLQVHSFSFLILSLFCQTEGSQLDSRSSKVGAGTSHVFFSAFQSCWLFRPTY